MIVIQPVLEVHLPDDFALWEVVAREPYTFMPLHGALDAAEVGTAVMSIAECNIDTRKGRRPPPPADPLGAFLHPLLTTDNPFAPGGLRITDTATGITFSPGCCEGLDERRGWTAVTEGDDGGQALFGHDPCPLAQRLGERVRLTVDSDREDSLTIDLPVTELRRLLADAERDLADFLQLTGQWAAQHLPDHAAAVTTACARALRLPAPARP